MNTVWMEKCAQAGEFLYGIYPYEVLMQLYRLKENDRVLKTELRRFINEHPALMQEYVQKRLPFFETMGYTEVGYVIPYVPEEGKVLDFFRKAVQDGNAYAVLHTDVNEIYNLLKDASLDRFLNNEDYHVDMAYVFSNSGEILRDGKIIYYPIYMVMFLNNKNRTSAKNEFKLGEDLKFE